MADQTPCVNCTHAQPPPIAAFHVGTIGACRIGGCSCKEFRAVDAPAEREPQRVCVNVPDGYAVRIELVPIGVFEPTLEGS